MPKLKNNHTIPKCLIKEWAIQGPSYQGVYVYESRNDTTYFSSGNRSSAYSFAIEPNLYIAKKDDKRVVVVEQWLAGVENTFNIFLDGLKANRDQYLVKEKKYFDLLLIALFSLRHRSKHNFAAIQNFLIKNPGYKDKIGSSSEEDMNIIVLENFINCTIEEAQRFANCEMIICKNTSGNLILGDRPFIFNSDQDDYSFIPLTPNYLVSLRKIQEPSYHSRNDQALTNDMVHNFNQMIAQNSREWIVATTKETVQKYIPDFTAEKQDASPFYEQVEKLKYGYKIG